MADMHTMTIPPPGWHNQYIEDEAARRDARLESSRVRRFMARAFQGFLIALVITIVVGFLFFMFIAYIQRGINGPE